MTQDPPSRRPLTRRAVLGAGAAAGLAAAGLGPSGTLAQDATPAAGGATPWQPPVQTEQVVLPQPDYRYPGNEGITVADSDPPQFPQPVRPPAGAPNVLLVLVDDAGFGQFGAFGGPVPTPAAEKLRDEGLSFNRFHTTALCSPTRAALITGRNHHSVAFGNIGEVASGYDGYTSIIPKSAATVAETLQLNGYSTAWFGKNHNVPVWEQSAAGPFDHWPTGMGFDYFYGFVGGEIDQWHPMLWEQTVPVTPYLNNPDYNLNVDLADKAIAWIRDVTTVAPEKPFFCYYCPGATHAPHQVPREWIDKFAGQFDQGWDKLREETFARQKALGVIPADAELTPRPAEIPAWDSFDAEQRRIMSRQAEVFAAYTAQTDHEIGRLIDYVQSLPNAANTLVLYLIGDNGASAEGGLTGTINEFTFFNAVPPDEAYEAQHLDEWGSPTTYPHQAVGWGWAMNTPFQWTKQVASHFGGTRNPMIVSWPARNLQAGGLRSQFHHVIDVAPTLLEAAGIPQPTIVNGVAQMPIEGVSMLYAFDDAAAPDRRTRQYFEIMANRGLYDRGWTAVSKAILPWQVSDMAVTSAFNLYTAKWELYDIDKDFSQAHDLAAQQPEKLAQMQDQLYAEFAKYHVFPENWNMALPLVGVGEWARPSNWAEGQKSFVFQPGMTRMQYNVIPPLYNRSFRVTAEAEIPEGGAEGALVALGGIEGGWSMTIEGGKLVFNYNYMLAERTAIASDVPVPAGAVTLVADLAYDGGGYGKGATVTLFANGQQIGQGRLDRTTPQAFGTDGFDIGGDYGSPVNLTYQAPFPFTGTLGTVTLELT